MKGRIILTFVVLSALLQSAWGQPDFGKLPEILSMEKARITDVGVAVRDIEMYVRLDSLTQQTDTAMVISDPEVIWQSEQVDVYDSVNVERAMKPRRATRRKALQDVGLSQWGNLKEGIFVDFFYYVFRFEYPSVDANGDPIMLSAIAACPTPSACDEVNNIIIGTHATITADNLRPSAQVNNFKQNDWGMLFTLASGGTMILNETMSSYLVAAQAGTFIGVPMVMCIPGIGTMLASALLVAHIFTDVVAIKQVDKRIGNQDCKNNLVIMPDYEGYGLTKDRAHPYLYQELTARQCVDAARYGRYLYEHAEELTYLRHPLREDFRTISMGYSQGGATAMAVHRFVEQNDLTDELHFTGSACGDGPYDLMATFMFYMQQSLEGKNMSLSVVLPLIVKGMLDSNPYMVNHKAEEYFRPEVLETGVLDWIASKQYSTGDIDRMWEDYANKHPGAKDYHNCNITDLMKDEIREYFMQVYNDNKDTFTSAAGIPLPTHRGLAEDLHLALASNDLTSGWKPKHRLMLFHSEGDNVVPYVNAERAKNALGRMVELEDARNKLDHIDSGIDFFRGDDEIFDLGIKRMLNLRMNEYVDKLCSDTWKEVYIWP